MIMGVGEVFKADITFDVVGAPRDVTLFSRCHKLMAIYLGEEGHIELRRRSVNETLSFILSPADVDTAAHRFSFKWNR